MELNAFDYHLYANQASLAVHGLCFGLIKFLQKIKFVIFYQRLDAAASLVTIG